MENVNPQAADAATTTTSTPLEQLAKDFLEAVSYGIIQEDVNRVYKQKKFKHIGWTTEWMAKLEEFVFHGKRIIEAQQATEYAEKE